MAEENTYHDYWQHVDSIASEILKEVMDEDSLADAEDRVNELISEAADGDYYVIYTHASAAGLQHSDNEQAWFDQFGELQADSYGDALSKMMYAALDQDIRDRFDQDALEQHFEDE